MRKVGGLMAALPLMVASLAAAQPAPLANVREWNEVEAEYLHQARRVLRSFLATGVPRDCYRVLFRRREPHLEVTFSSRRPISRVEGEPVDTAAESCPPSVTYLIDRRGRVVSRFRPR